MGCRFMGMWHFIGNFILKMDILVEKTKAVPFNPKQISFFFFFFSIPFFIVSFQDLKNYSYYLYNQPKYKSLHTITGEVIHDDRLPPGKYKERLDGIYIKTKNKNINIYCGNVNKLLVGYGARGIGGVYAPGRCDWIAVKLEREGKCISDSNKIFCENPRNLYGYKVYAKVDDNMTIYELKLNDSMFYTYGEMVSLYRDRSIANLKSDLSFWFIFFILSLLFFIISRNDKYKNLRILSSIK